jgi:hypothetical protein
MPETPSSGGRMGKVKVRYLIERCRRKSGMARYWWPTAKLQRLGSNHEGFSDNLAEAVHQAEALNAALGVSRRTTD